MIGLYIVLAVLAVLVVAAILVFNRLVQKRQMVSNGWADIDVQLKRRADLIPIIVTSVQGYAAHERDLFEEVVAKRNAAVQAGDDPATRSAAESALARPMTKLLAVAEDYPDLKASQNFLDLQDELSDTENKIEMARRFYNGAVRELNIAVQSFPANLIAGVFGFAKAAFFEIDTADRALPDLNLGAN